MGRGIISLLAANFSFLTLDVDLQCDGDGATRMENMKVCKIMITTDQVRKPIFLVSLDLWILANGAPLLAKSVNSSEICLAHITSLCMQIGTVDAVKTMQAGGVVVEAGEILSVQYKLEAFCADLRRGARRPLGGFG